MENTRRGLAERRHDAVDPIPAVAHHKMKRAIDGFGRSGAVEGRALQDPPKCPVKDMSPVPMVGS